MTQYSRDDREIMGDVSDDDEFQGMESEKVDEINENLDIIEPNGCWQKFKRGLRALWRTRDMEDVSGNRELYVSTTLRELGIYLVFLAIMIVVAFGMINPNSFYFTNALNNVFIGSPVSGSSLTFATMIGINDFWQVLSDPIMSAIYQENWYNNAPVDQANFMAVENKVLGVARLRQVKVRSDSCDVPDTFKDSIKECYTMYAPAVEDKKSFGLKNGTAWVHTNQSALDSMETTTTLGSYGGGGFYVDLTRDRAGADAIISDLKSNLWIQRGTRAVFLDLSVYNPNINLFCIIKLVFEFPATGGVVPYYQFRTVKLLRYVTTFDYIILLFEIAYIVFIFYYIVEEYFEIKKNSYHYFFNFWNILDIIVIAISLICSIFNVYRTNAVGNKLDSLLLDQTRYIDFNFLSYWQLQFNNAIAMGVFLANVKIFKYISFNKTMTQLSATLGHCAKDLAGFAIMFFTIFLAFAQLGYLIFGAQVDRFNTFTNTILTLFRIILGDFDFNSLEAANRVLGPMYFLFYVFFVFFVLLNMFIAIINETYSQVKEELAEKENEFEVTDFFKEKADHMLEKMNIKREKIIDIQNALKEADTNNDGKIDFDELRAVLKMKGYADIEIEALLSAYDSDGDQTLDLSEQAKLQSDLEKEKKRLSKKMAGEDDNDSGHEDEVDDEEVQLQKKDKGRRDDVTKEAYKIVANRVNRMESTVDMIVAKIDSVLFRIENIDPVKYAMSSTVSVRDTNETRNRDIGSRIRMSRPATAWREMGPLPKLPEDPSEGQSRHL